MREQATRQIKQADFYESLNSGIGIDNFLLSITYYRAELSTLCDQLSLLTTCDSGLPENIAERIGLFQGYFKKFVQKFDTGRLKTAARSVEENNELQSIIDKIQERLHAVSHRLETNAPVRFQSLQLSFELMKTVELSQIDLLLWGLLTISMNLKERSDRKSVSGENVVKVVGQVDTVLDDEKDLAHAREVIEWGRIELYGQGIFGTDQELIETEILMRVKDRHGTMMNPEAFLKFVKKAGYIEKLDWMILSLSFMFISNNETNGPISINVNPDTIQDVKFVDKIKALSLIHHVDPKKIIIELLEYESSINFSHTNQVIRELRALGFRIAIDDFPSWYNTLWDISKFLDIDIIKIDGPHVMEIFKVCSRCHAIRECMSSLETNFWQDQRCIRKLDMMYDLETLIFSLKFLKMQNPNVKFFAERVEDKRVFDFLKQLDLISGYQGYYFEKPKHLFKGGEESDRVRIEESSLAISFQASAIKVERPTKTVQPEVKMELIQIFAQQVEEYTDGLLGLDSCFSLGDIESDTPNEALNATLAKIITFLWGDSMNFYLFDDEKKKIHVKNISIAGNVAHASIPVAKEFLNRVNKQYVNLFTLLQDTPDSEKHGYRIASTAVPWRGDDIVVKVNDRIFLGLDDSETAMVYDKKLQINFLLLFAMIIKNKLVSRGMG